MDTRGAANGLREYGRAYFGPVVGVGAQAAAGASKAAAPRLFNTVRRVSVFFADTLFASANKSREIVLVLHHRRLVDIHHVAGLIHFERDVLAQLVGRVHVFNIVLGRKMRCCGCTLVPMASSMHEAHVS